MDLWVVLQVVVGALITVGIVLFVKYFQKPKFKLTIEDAVDASYPANRLAQTARFLRLIVQNKKSPSLAKWLSRNAAVRCYRFINFHNLDRQDVFGRLVPIKCSKLPGVQLFPDGRVELDIVVRYNNDTECYGWCYDNYFSNRRWRNPDWKLEDKRYFVKV